MTAGLRACTLGEFDPERVHFMVCQHQDDEVEAGVEQLHQLRCATMSRARASVWAGVWWLGRSFRHHREPNAGPLLGLCDRQRGTTVLTEVPEMFGAERILMSHCRDEATFEKTVTMVNDFKQYFIAHNQPIYENPSPGNKAGGITTLEALGCTQKAGASRWWILLRRAPENPRTESPERPGERCGCHQRAGRCGCHMVLFSTGRGTPYGGFVPTVKIATNSELAAKKKLDRL